MPEPDDIALLKQYADENSESAFAELVTRYVNLVYSAALRSVGNAHAAQEITQAVFIILARKANQLPRHALLSGWLYQTARLTAANYVRTEIRRQNREQEAYMQAILNEPESEAWRQISPLLDDAMGRLGEKDRNAIVLRFFENKNLREVGQALGASEDAAKMRVNRALEKLRKVFTRRGVALSGAIIAGAVSANSVQAAPAALAKTISFMALAKGATVPISTLTLIKGALKIMAWTQAKIIVTTIGVAVILAASTTGVVGYKIVQTHRHTANVSLENDIQPDGTIYARLSLEIINTTHRTITPQNTWTMSLPIAIQRFTDDAGQPIQFTQKPAPNGHFAYDSFLTRSVPPGEKFAAKIEGTVNGIGVGEIKSTGGPGVFELQDSETASGYAMHCAYNYRLPPGAVLLDKSPNLKEVTIGGRIEMRFDQVLPPRAKAAYHFRYRLPAQAN